MRTMFVRSGCPITTVLNIFSNKQTFADLPYRKIFSAKIAVDIRVCSTSNTGEGVEPILSLPAPFRHSECHTKLILSFAPQ